LIFHITTEVEEPYKGDYAAQTEVRPSRYYKSFFAQKLRNRVTIP